MTSSKHPRIVKKLIEMLLVFQECKIAAVLEDSYHFKLIGDKGFLSNTFWISTDHIIFSLSSCYTILTDFFSLGKFLDLVSNIKKCPCNRIWEWIVS